MMLKAIADATGSDAATALAEIGRRARGRKRPQNDTEEMRARERLGVLHPDTSNMRSLRESD